MIAPNDTIQIVKALQSISSKVNSIFWMLFFMFCLAVFRD